MRDNVWNGAKASRVEEGKIWGYGAGEEFEEQYRREVQDALNISKERKYNETKRGKSMKLCR